MYIMYVLIGVMFLRGLVEEEFFEDRGAAKFGVEEDTATKFC